MHIAIPVKYWKESIDFYKCLGFKEVKQWVRENKGLKGLWMENKDNFRIELIFHFSNKKLKIKIPETLHIGVEIKNIERKLKELRKVGLKIIIPPTKGITVKRFVFVLDPNGLPIELFVPPEREKIDN